MKKFFGFIALAAISLSAFAEDCESFVTPNKGSVSITFKRYVHKEISGIFTVNALGDRVRFAQGNLQYRATTNTWRFAENQYDVIGTDNGNIGENNNGWIDLFGFGTSGWSGTGAAAYRPWDVSSTATDYHTGSASGTNVNADWAYYNAIVNGGDEGGPAANMWYTLSRDEWDYLLARESGVLCGMGSLNGINGLFLLPDDWAIKAAGLAGDEKNFADNFVPLTIAKSFSNNSIASISVWDKLEEAGVVFLPVTGTRTGSGAKSTSNVASHGHYWTTSRYNDATANMLYFYDSYCEIYRATRAAGRAVRPVQKLRTSE